MTPDAFVRAAGPGRESSDFDLNPAVVLPEGRRLRPAAVLVALMQDARGASVILTRRSAALRHHPGQIAFPGGKIEAGDEGPVCAALRESAEEIGLDPGNAEVFGCLPAHETVTGFTVTPVLAKIRRPFEWRPEAGEVDEVFAVPLSHVTDPANYMIHGRMWRGSLRRYYVVPWGPYYIWGATARILRVLAERMAA
jgi:8-oxo-dGTP pyrophosphatase MutT (NUDIX family)